MPVTSSLRPDLSRWRDSHCLCHEWRLVKSRRPELATGNYATDTSHPFSCSYEQPRTSSVEVEAHLLQRLAISHPKEFGGTACAFSWSRCQCCRSQHVVPAKSRYALAPSPQPKSRFTSPTI